MQLFKILHMFSELLKDNVINKGLDKKYLKDKYSETLVSSMAYIGWLDDTSLNTFKISATGFGFFIETRSRITNTVLSAIAIIISLVALAISIFA